MEHVVGQTLCLVTGHGSRQYVLPFPFKNRLIRFQDVIGVNPDTHGSMVVLLLLGSDKTLASNATGQSEFHPLYLSLGNIKNTIRHGHRDTVVPIGFLAIPKSTYYFLKHSKLFSPNC